MGKPISYKTDERIIALWYAAHLREYIIKETATSAGHISDVVKQEYELVGQGNVEALRRLAAAAGKPGHTLPDLMKAIRFNNACRLQYNLDVDDVVETLPTIVEQCASHNLKLRELPQKIEHDIAELKDLEVKKEALAKEVQQFDARHKQAFQNANTTEQELAKYRSLKERLEKKGLSLDSLDKIENMLANAEAAKYDFKELVNIASSFRSLAERNAQLTSENSSLETKIKENHAAMQQQNITLTQNSERLGQLDKLDRIGFGLRQLVACHELAARVATAHGLDASKATEKLLADMEQDYDGFVGLQKAIERLTSQVKQTEVKLESLQALVAAIDQAVHVVMRLYSEGIKQDSIVAIYNIVHDSGLTFEELQTAIARYGSLKAALTELEQQRSKLEAEKRGLKTEVEHLEGEKIARQAALKAINDSLAIEFQTAFKEAVVPLTLASKQVQNSCANAAKAVDEIGAKARDNVELFKKSTAIHAFVPLAKAMMEIPVSQSELRTAIILVFHLALKHLPMDALTRSNLQDALHSLEGDYSIDL